MIVKEIKRTKDIKQATTYGLGGKKPVYSRLEIGIVSARYFLYSTVIIRD